MDPGFTGTTHVTEPRYVLQSCSPMVTALATVTLTSGETVPQLGQGTWRMGESRRTFDAELAVINVIAASRISLFSAQGAVCALESLP